MSLERFYLSADTSNILSNEHWLRYEAVVPMIKDKVVLDVACGSGYGSDHLATSGAKKVIGLDIDGPTIEANIENYQRDNLAFKKASALKLPFKDGEFDVVVSFETIEHFNEDDQMDVMAEFKRVLSPEGLLIISTPNIEYPHYPNPFHLRELSKFDLVTLVQMEHKYMRIYEQGSAIATFIADEDDFDGRYVLSTGFIPKYFITISSDREIDEMIPPMATLNSEALRRQETSPAKKIMDTFYRPLIKVPFIKKMVDKINKGR